MALPRSKVQVWIISPKSDILLFKMTAERGGGWQPITGGVEDQESLEQAALREVQEESRLEIKKVHALKLDFKFKDRWGDAHEHVFWTQVDKNTAEIRIDPREHSEYEWMSLKKAMSLLKYPQYQQSLLLIAKVHTENGK